MQGARNRRRREGEHIDVLLHLLDALFVRDPEPLLFVDHQQAQPMELDVFTENLMRTDDNIDRAFFQAAQGLSRLGFRNEPREHLDLDRIGREPLPESAQVLLCKNRRRAENRDLTARIDDFKRGPNGDFRFAVANVAADQAVHRLVVFQVSFDVFDRRHLVRGLFVGESILHLRLPRRIGGQRVSG